MPPTFEITVALDRIRERLLDLSPRNRLLNYKRNSSSISVVDELPSSVFKLLVDAFKEMLFKAIPEPESEDDATLEIDEDLPNAPPEESELDLKYRDKFLQTNLLARELENRLRRISADARSVIEETGQNRLFIALGFLEWRDKEKTEQKYLAPLILVPVELERKSFDSRSGSFVYGVKYTGEDLIPNLSLRYKLKNDFALELPGYDASVGEDGGDNAFDPEHYFVKVADMIKNMTEWQVHRRIVLGFFSFSKLLMYQDLDPHAHNGNNRVTSHPIIRHLLEGSELNDNSTRLTEIEDSDESRIIFTVPNVVEADSSQLSVISAALVGHNLVVHGPPGTGKSQTITNLIASFLEKGKSVLFIAEKMAALRVVYRNLQKVGLDDFCLQLHSHKAKKSEVLTDLQRRAGKTYPHPRGLDAELESLVHLRTQLQGYLDAIHDKIGSTGLTIYEVLGKVELLIASPASAHSLKVANAESLTIQMVEERLRAINALTTICVDSPNVWKCCWSGYRPIDLYLGDEEIVKESFKALGELCSSLSDTFHHLQEDFSLDVHHFTPSLLSLQNLLTFASIPLPVQFQDDVATRILSAQPDTVYEAFDTLIDYIKNYTDKLQRIKEIAEISDTCTAEQLVALKESTSRINSLGFGELTWNSATQFLSCIRHLRDAISQVLELHKNEAWSTLGNPSTKSEFVEQKKIATQLRAMPKELPYPALSTWFLPNALSQYSTTAKKCEMFVTDNAILSKEFVLSDVPDFESLRNIRLSLRKHHKSFLAMFSQEYRSAKSAVLTFLRDRKSFRLKTLPDRLEALESHLTEKKAFAANNGLRTYYGELFKGMDTAWSEGVAVLNWCLSLTTACESNIHAFRLAAMQQQLVDGLPSEKTLDHLSNRLDSGFGEAERLCGFNSIQLSTAPSGEELSFTALLDRLSILETSLEQFVSSVNGAANPTDSLTIRELLNATTLTMAAKELESKILGFTPAIQFLGTAFSGRNTNVEFLRGMSKWLREVRKSQLSEKEISGLAFTRISELSNYVNASRIELSKLINGLAPITSRIAQFGKIDWTKLIGTPLESCDCVIMKEFCVELARESSSLPIWADYCRISDIANNLGLDQVVRMIESEEISAIDSAQVFSFAFYNTLARSAIRSNPILASFSSAYHDEVRHDFANTDRRIQNTRIRHIAYEASKQRPPGGVSRGLAKDLTDMALLSREFGKSKKHIPIRQLVHRAGDAIQALKPVFMMSPMSVAQFTDLQKSQFDVVIMDEASQIKPHEALGSIARGKQVIVVGDPRQLPPTTFFDKQSDNDGEDLEELVGEDTESILDMCTAVRMTSKSLLWHYRSEHQNLIAFSNSQWYESRLTIFPTPTQSNLNLGVRFNFVPGARYAAGKNEKEAEFIVEAIIRHARQEPELSLGVGTFSISQRDVINDLLDKICKKDPDTDRVVQKLMQPGERGEPLFVKNLENLQGDERDVIFISCTYGPDSETGKVYQRFGPINQRNGPRRLNVMFTRAKKRMEVFTSMQPEDILAGPEGGAGAIALRKFLEYAKTGIIPSYGTISEKEPDSDFEVAVMKALEANGYKCQGQIGVSGYFIDIGVIHPDLPNRIILGVECDGARYHSSKFARDRDRLREEVLHKRGWNLFRIWSTDWFKNRDSVIANLLIKLADLRERDKHLVVEVTETKPEVAVTNELTHESRLSDIELKVRLEAFRRANNMLQVRGNTIGILGDELIPYFLKHRPVSRQMFLATFPIELRTLIDYDEVDFLDDILAIIDGATHQ